MVLNADIEGFFGKFYRFDQSAVWRHTADFKPCAYKLLFVIVIKLVAVAVALADFGFAVAFFHNGMGCNYAGIGAKTKGAALVDIVVLTGHKIDNLVFALLVKLARVGVFYARYVSCVLDNRYLHTKTDAKVRNIVFAGVLRRQNHTLDTALIKAAGHYNTLQIFKGIGNVIFIDFFRVYPMNFNVGVIKISRVAHGFGYRKVGVVKPDVFAHKADMHGMGAVFDALYHFYPAFKIGFFGFKPEFAADNRRKVGLLKHKGGFVEVWQGDIFDNAIGFYVAKQRDFFEDTLFQRLVATKDDNIGVNAHALQFFDRVLGGFAFVLFGAVKVRHKGYVDKKTVFATYFE